MNMQTVDQKTNIRRTTRTRWIWVLLLLLIVAAGGTWWMLKPPPAIYRGWLTGLIPSGKGSMIVAYSPVNNTAQDILQLPKVTADNYGAVSPDGHYAAYTQWNDNQTLRFLNVQSLDSKQSQPSKTYFKDVKDKFEAKYLTWYPDSNHLAFVTNTVNVYSNENITTLNAKTGELHQNATGGLWNIPSNNPDPNAPLPGKHIESQAQLDEILHQFGADSYPIKKAATILYVKLSSPAISADGKQIAYSATLFRNFALNEKVTWLGSAIYVVDTNGGTPQLVYHSDKQSALGAVTWINDGKQLAFLRYHEMNGGDGQIDTLDLGSKQVKSLVTNTKDHFVNLNPLGLPNHQLSFITVKEGGTDADAVRMLVDTNSGLLKSQSIQLHDQKMFWKFSVLN